ncbi:MAG: CBS domain-containing protein [Gammaproteobacteria bacterium]
MKGHLVKDIMTVDVLSIAPDSTLPEARRLMSSKKVRRLPVLDAGKLVGIISLSDVDEASPSGASTLSIWELNYVLAKLQVKEVMTRDPITVTPETTVGETARLMAQKKIGGIPVVDAAGALAGVVTESDIFRLVAREWSAS